MSDPLTGLIEALRDRYRIDREIGRGGVAIVFRAHDVRHDRWVALKLLQDGPVRAVDDGRFHEAIRTAARLQHPHILAVHDSGEDGGLRWFTTPFVRGETLRARLLREGPLPLGDALRIAREAADALDYAHREGVVHRDVTPENIALTEGHALVADFGIARMLGGEAGAAPPYLSPEQATGAPVDPRTDVYALGVVLYEMLLGEPPFAGPTPQSVIARIITERPLPPRSLRASVPASVEALVLRALARDPAGRFATAAGMRDALDEAMADVRSGPARPQATSQTEWPLAGRGVWVWPLLLTFLGGLLVGAGLWLGR